jgi:hypothetical protein
MEIYTVGMFVPGNSQGDTAGCCCGAYLSLFEAVKAAATVAKPQPGRYDLCINRVILGATIKENEEDEEILWATCWDDYPEGYEEWAGIPKRKCWYFDDDDEEKDNTHWDDM